MDQVVVVIGKGHELVEIAETLLAVAKKWEDAEKLRKGIRVRAVRKADGNDQGNPYTIRMGLGSGEEEEQEDEKLEELFSIAHALQACLRSAKRSSQEVEVTISLI